jgi:hypothetical protein
MSENTNHLATTENSINLTGNAGSFSPGSWGHATYVVQDNKNFNAGSTTGVSLTDAKGNTVVVGTFMGTRYRGKL